MKLQENISEIDQFIIDFVRELRLTKNLTQNDLANILEVSRTFISGVESSSKHQKYNITHVNALADYFDISPKAFLPEKAFPVNPTPRSKKIPSQTAPAKKATRRVKK